MIENPFLGEGQTEELKYNFKGYWSRRVNQRDQIYRVEEEILTVIIVSAMGHYSDK